MSIKENKLLLLKWTANQSDEEFVYDKEFNDEIRLIYTQLGRFDVNRVEINNKLKDSFDKYHLGLIRALLSNIHFLNNTAQLKRLFADLFEKVIHYIKENNQLFNLLLNELQFFSDSKLDVAELFIVFLLDKLQIPEKQIEKIFNDVNYNDQFKFFLFKTNCSSKTHLKILLEYFVKYSLAKPYSTHQIDSLIEEYSENTGMQGLELAINKYKVRGISDSNGITYHGTKLIAAFKDELAKWLYRFSEIPVRALIEPIILAIPGMSVEKKSQSIIILFNQWGEKKPDILNLLKKHIIFQKITNEKFSYLLNGSAKNVIRNQINLTHRQNYTKAVINELKLLLTQKNKEAIESIIENADGQTLFYCLMVPNPKFCNDIFHYILDFSKKYKPDDKEHPEWSNKLRTYREYIYIPENFQKLPQSKKHASVAASPFYSFMEKPIFEKIAHYCSPNISKRVWGMIGKNKVK